MPAEKPTPIPLDGKRAADRIRSIFFLIAAANVVVMIIVLLLRPTAGKDRAGAAAKSAATQEANANHAQTEERREPAVPGK